MPGSQDSRHPDRQGLNVFQLESELSGNLSSPPPSAGFSRLQTFWSEQSLRPEAAPDPGRRLAAAAHGRHPLLRAAWGAAPRHVHPCGPAPGPQTGTSSRSTAIAGMIGQDEVIAEWAALIQPLEKGGAGTAQGEGLEDGGRVGALPPARHAQDCGEHQELGGGRRRLPLSRNQRCRHPRPRPPAPRTRRGQVSIPHTPICGPSFRSPGH